MLLKCPECELQVSEKALVCPHCGYPMKPDAKPRSTRRTRKRQRLPNGFGQISEIKGRKLKKPFRAMVTVGKDPETAKPICKPLKPESYFATYNGAYAALVEYNKNPYSLESATITMNELFKMWFEEYEKRGNSKSRLTTVKGAWKYCSGVYDLPVIDLKTYHVKQCVEHGTINGDPERTPPPTVVPHIKWVISQVLDYGIECEIIDRNCAKISTAGKEIIKQGKKNRKGHQCFTEDEMKKLWDNADTIPFVDVILIQCYSGWRPQELMRLKIEDVNLVEWSFKGGMKTDSGKDRIVPIHPRIRGFVQKYYAEAQERNCEYLFSCCARKKYKPFTYYKLRTEFDNIMSKLELNPNHRPHDGRVQFVTMAKRYNVDEYAIKHLAGHKIIDITEAVYTKRDFSWLASEIQKIK